MKILYNITPELTKELKHPFGEFLTGTFFENAPKIRAIIEQEHPPKLISVGDIVSSNLQKQDFAPQLLITDNRCMRKPRKTIISGPKITVFVNNPQGTITQEAANAIRNALAADEQVHIIVDGEEDLLALIAVLYAPEKSLVIYGQPNEGIVVIKVTPERKRKAKEILKAMKTVRNTK